MNGGDRPDFVAMPDRLADSPADSGQIWLIGLRMHLFSPERTVLRADIIFLENYRARRER